MEPELKLPGVRSVRGAAGVVESPVLTGKDLCDIIKACAKARVSQLKLRGVHIEFLVKGEKTKTQPQVHLDTEISEAKLEEVQSDYIKQASSDVRDDLESDLLHTDPEAYEDLLSQGEFDAAGSTRRTDQDT